MENIYTMDSNYKTTGATILISDKTDFRKRTIPRYKVIFYSGRISP